MMEAKLLQSRPASTTSSSQGEDGCLEVEDSVNSDIGDDEMIVWEDQHIQHKGCFA
jgi:hypothetical protein